VNLNRSGYWPGLALLILAVKAAFYFLDHQIGFVLGDSAGYLNMALNGIVPPDRSYVYGYLVRWATLGNSSLDLLILAQIIAGSLTSLLLAFILVKFLRCSQGIAAAAALLAAVEPIEVLYERYVMTEVFGLLTFALFLITILYYLRRGHIGLLLLAAALAIFSDSLRTAYLPVVLGVGSLAILYHALFVIGKKPTASVANGQIGSRLSALTTHLLIFLLVSGFFLSLESKPKPATSEGAFLLSAWSPLLAKPPFDSTPLVTQFTRSDRCELDWDSRSSQQWWPGCLMANITSHFRDEARKSLCDEYESNRIAQQQANQYALSLAGQILRTYPLEVLQIGARNWQALWDREQLAIVLAVDHGAQEYPEEFIKMMHKNYGLEVRDWNKLETPLKTYFGQVTGWYWWVILSPFFLILWWLATFRLLNPGSLIISAASVALLVVVTLPMSSPSIRLYHGIAWLSIIGLASALDRIAKRHAQKDCNQDQ
jgi:hypothetical protein